MGIEPRTHALLVSIAASLERIATALEKPAADQAAAVEEVKRTIYGATRRPQP